MNSSSPSPLPGRSRGSALITVIIFTTVIALLAGSIVAWSLTERKLNTRTVYWLEARNAAEALCEYGASQINYTNTNFDAPPTLDPFGGITGTNVPLQLPFIPGAPNSFFNPGSSNGLPGGDTTHDVESHIDTNPLSLDAYGLELIGGKGVKISNPGSNLFYIDQAIPENLYDPFSGLWVRRNDYMVLAKATAVPLGGLPPITAFVTQTVSVRAAPLFNFAIFYGNNDLEIYPGADMIVSGPVHVNGSMFLNATSGSTLTFTGRVSASGDIYHAEESKTAQQSPMANDNILFAQGTKTLSMLSSSTWHDSTMGQDTGVFGTDTIIVNGQVVNKLAAQAANATGQTFIKYAKTTWPGNVLTQYMGIKPFNPAAFGQPLQPGTDSVAGSGKPYLPDSLYVDSGDQAAVANAAVIDEHAYTDASGTTLVEQKGNVSYINDPPNANFNINAAVKDIYYVSKAGLEAKKYANLANLYILVVVKPGSPDTATITYYGPYNQGTLKTAGYGPNGGVLMGTPAGSGYSIPGYKTIAGTSVATTAVEPAKLVSFVPYHVNGGGNVDQGLFDQREAKGVDLVQLDMHALNLALTEVNVALMTPTAQAPTATPPSDAIINLNGPYTTTPTNNIWGSGQNAGAVAGTTAADNTGCNLNNIQKNGGWNGIVYVDIEWNGTPTANTEVALGIGDAETHTTTTGGTTNIDTNAVANLANYNGGAITDLNTTTNLIPNDQTPRLSGIPQTRNSAVGIDWTAALGNVSTPAVGLSVATNAPVYIEGNFNADGYIDKANPPAATPTGIITGGPQLPDDEKSYLNGTWSNNSNPIEGTAEVPVAIVGDAVTILSPCYFGGDVSPGKGKPPTTFVFPLGGTISGTNPITTNPWIQNAPTSPAYQSNDVSKSPISATITEEFAGAIVAGIRPTDSTGAPGGGGSASGGANNLPRFIEDWKNTAQCIRGSLVNLYASKFATGRFHGNDSRFTPNKFFEPPDRHWGWANLFESGVFPPGTPVAYSVRRMYFNDLPADGPAPTTPGDQPTNYTKARIDGTWGWQNDAGKFPSVTGP